MAESERQERILRKVFEEAHHASLERTPPFASLWSSAVADRGAAAVPAAGQRAAVAVLAAAVLVVVILVGVGRSGRSTPSRLEQAAAAAAGIGDWRAPLDFLLETPGRQWLETTPRWSFDRPIDVPEAGLGSTEEVTR